MKVSQWATFSAAYARSSLSLPAAAASSGIPHSSRKRRLYDNTRPSGSTTSTPSSIASCCALRIARVVPRDENVPARAPRNHRANFLRAAASLDGLREEKSDTCRVISLSKRFILDQLLVGAVIRTEELPL